MEKMQNKPDFLIIGAMKSGTTILYDYICEHTDVIKAKQKEIHYFTLYPDKGNDWYFSHFKSCKKKITGEASPTYLHLANTDGLPSSIKKLLPDVKIILIVRDPVERAISHFFHYQKVNKIKELINIDINLFFSMSFKNASNRTTSLDRYLHDILSFSAYYKNYMNFVKVFGSEKILVLNNNELIATPHETMQRVFNYLGLKAYDSELFDQFKYSTGSSVKALSSENINRLAKFLYPDFEKFCNVSGIKFNNTYEQHSTSKTSVGIGSKNTKVIAPDEVSIGHDGWLFLEGGANKSARYYKDLTLDIKLIQDWHNLLKKRHENLTKYGVKYIHLFCPNKLSIYPENYKGELKNFLNHPLKCLMNFNANNEDYLNSIINPVPYFIKSKAKQQLYWKTDTHWTYQGCFCAYQLICSKLKILPNNELLDRPYKEGWPTMDLGGKCTPQIKEHGRFYYPLVHAKRVFSNPLVTYKEANQKENDPGLHAGSHVIFINQKVNNDLKVIIFGDSFSEYREHLLTGMLAETFKEVHFIWSSAIDYKYIEKNKPDIVITQIVERFISRLPDDSFDLERFVSEKMKSL